VPVVEPPGGIEMITGELLPVPLSATVCGLPVALSAMLSVATSSPVAVGVKVTPIVQLALAAKVPVGLHALVPLASAKLLLLVPVIELVTVTLCAGLVEFTVCEAKVKLLGATVTVAGPFTAVPVSVTVCGLPVALSVNEMEPVRVPAAVGLNVIWKVQGVPSTAMLGHCAVVAPAKSPVVAMLLNVTATPPVLDAVTVCAGLVVPTVWLGKVSDVGIIVIVPVCVAPVPVRPTACGLPVALSAILIEAVRVPAAVGLNVTLIVQFAVAASDAGQVLVWAKSPALVPVTLTLVIVNAALPLLVSVMLCAALVVPTVCELKVKLVGASVTAGPLAPVTVPVAVTVTLDVPSVVRISVCETAPPDAPVGGANVTVNVHELSGCTTTTAPLPIGTHPPDALKSGEFATFTPVNPSGPRPVFVIVTSAEVAEEPGATGVGKFTVGDAGEGVPGGAVTERAMVN
jgi:hypothetical protein